MAEFDYAKAVEELEKTAAMAEDPSVGIEDMDKYVRRTAELVAGCREYLRSVRNKIDGIGDEN